MDQLVDLVYSGRSGWQEAAVRRAFSDAFRERYTKVPDIESRSNGERRFQLRVNSHIEAGATPFAALVAPDQPPSGPYGGMSLVFFPPDQADEGSEPAPCLVGMVVGTHGMAPDDLILGKPGHARKCAAIAQWQRATGVLRTAWAKQDPTRTDLKLPDVIRKGLSVWQGALDEYGQLLYVILEPPRSQERADSRAALRDCLAALCDLFFDERGIEPKAAHARDAHRLRDQWLDHLLPGVDESRIADLLGYRRFVVVEGPPGTGKTRLAYEVLRTRYAGCGRVIQFHPGTTYESFVGGLGPRTGSGGGLAFEPVPGHLMQACEAARSDPGRRHLLVIDEINRADLSKVLGEAILLFEPGESDRSVRLAYDFAGIGDSLSLPPNLDVLGTMNSADRSIAILDVAVRRRFAFVPLYPQRSVVEQHGGARMNEAFTALLRLFVEHAGPEAMSLMPGHSYFLAPDDRADAALQTQLRPLLDEYLAQGYVAGFAHEVKAFIDTFAATRSALSADA
jgi:5-methylcytosine-specific restriction protein B